MQQRHSPERKNTPLIKVRYLPRCDYCYILLLYTYTNFLKIIYSQIVVNNVFVCSIPIYSDRELILYIYSFHFNVLCRINIFTCIIINNKTPRVPLDVILTNTYSRSISVLIYTYRHFIISLPLTSRYGPELVSLY